MKVGDLVEYVDKSLCSYETFTKGISHGNIGLVISVLARDKTTVKVRWFYNGGIEFWLGPQRFKVLTKEYICNSMFITMEVKNA